MNHVLVLEMFQQFSNTQTYLNKPCLDVKTFCEDMCFLIAFVKLTERCQLATPHHFVSRRDTPTRTIAT